MPNIGRPPGLDVHLSAITETMKGIQRDVGYTQLKEVYLGKGDGTGTIMAPIGTFPLRQVWYHYFDGNNTKVQGLAPLDGNSGIFYEDGKKYEGMQVKLGMPPRQLGGDKLTIFGVSGASGQNVLSNSSPMEQKVNDAGTSKLSVSTADGVTTVNAVTQINFPPGWVTGAGSVANIVPPVGSGGGGGGGAGSVFSYFSILSPGTFSSAVVAQTSANQSNISGATARPNFDTILQQFGAAASPYPNPITTGVGTWAFTAPASTVYYFGFELIADCPMSNITAKIVVVDPSFGTTSYNFGSFVIDTVNPNVGILQGSVNINAGSTAYITYKQTITVGAYNTLQGSFVEVGWNQPLSGSSVVSGTSTVIKTLVTSVTTTFATTQIALLPPGFTIYDVRIIPAAGFNPGTLGVTIGTTGGTTTDVTSASDVNLALAKMAFIPAGWKNVLTTNQIVNAYFSGLAGANNQVLTFIVSFV